MEATTLGLSVMLLLQSAHKTEQLLEQANANAAAQQVKQAMKHCRNALKSYNPEANKSLEEGAHA
jgi:hypothetical protein